MSVGNKDGKSSGKRKIEGLSTAETAAHKKSKCFDKDPKKSRVSVKKKQIPSRNFHSKVSTTTSLPEKQNWNELKKKKKELKVQRKKDKFSDLKLYEVDLQAKKIYEELKMKKTKRDKNDLSRELHEILKKLDYGKIILSHERSRMIQLLLKKAPHDIKLEIGNALLPNVVQIASSKYAQFCINRMLLFCGKEVREKLCDKLLGNIVKLASSNVSNSLIDLIYLKFASEDQKVFMRQEFYSDIYKNSKNKSVTTLKDTWNDSDVMKKGTLSALKANLMKIASKNLTDNCLVHVVLLEYLEESTEQERSEIVTCYSQHLAAISSTRQGMKAARLCYQHSSTKERRTMLKSMKEHIVKLCNHEHGHLLILSILNLTDDTLMVAKILLSTIVTNIKEIADNEFGKRVILFIVAPTNKFFHPSLLHEFEMELNVGTQKKNWEIRRKELIESFGKLILDSLNTEVVFWLKDGHIARVFTAILRSISDIQLELKSVFKAIATLISDSNWKITETRSDDIKSKDSLNLKETLLNDKKPKTVVDSIEINGIEHSGIHMSLKIILTLDGFAEVFLETVEDTTIRYWLKINRGCFMLVEMLKHLSKNNEIRNDLFGRISAYESELKEYTHAGAKVLRNLIQT